MEKINFKVENKEEPRKLIGTLVLTRHSETKYTEQYPDLTEKGIEMANKQGARLGNELKEADKDRVYISSPSPRALGTNDIFRKKIEKRGSKNNTTVHKSDQIRAADIYDKEEFEQRINNILEKYSNDPKAVWKVYDESTVLQKNKDGTDMIESKSKIRTRTMRALEYLIRSFCSSKNKKPPSVIATSHFEIINPIINQIFPNKNILFDYVECTEIKFYKTSNPKKF